MTDNNIRSMHPMPKLVIDNCSSEENIEFIKTKAISSKRKSLLRSLSLPHHDQTYKDLSGAIHYSSMSRSKNYFVRSHSYPNYYFPIEKSFYSPSFSAKTHAGMVLLDPNNGTYSPGGSSSRYSLYGSFFNISESGYYPSVVKPDNKLLAGDGSSLINFDHSLKLLTNTYQDKCTDWLSHLDTT